MNKILRYGVFYRFKHYSISLRFVPYDYPNRLDKTDRKYAELY